MYVDVARDFVGVVFHVLLDGAKRSHNLRNRCCLEPPNSLNLDFQVFVLSNVHNWLSAGLAVCYFFNSKSG